VRFEFYREDRPGFGQMVRAKVVRLSVYRPGERGTIGKGVPIGEIEGADDDAVFSVTYGVEPPTAWLLRSSSTLRA
jgi:hypothetical protein